MINVLDIPHVAHLFQGGGGGWLSGSTINDFWQNLRDWNDISPCWWTKLENPREIQLFLSTSGKNIGHNKD